MVASWLSLLAWFAFMALVIWRIRHLDKAVVRLESELQDVRFKLGVDSDSFVDLYAHASTANMIFVRRELVTNAEYEMIFEHTKAKMVEAADMVNSTYKDIHDL
jgi:hypothetical protein